MRSIRPGDPFVDAELVQICGMVRRMNMDAPAVHPAAIRRRFRGITTSILQAIRDLYCDRVGRSVASVIEILDGLAIEANSEPIDPLAVWILCIHFDAQRREKQEPTIEMLNNPWRVEVVQPSVWLLDRFNEHFMPEITLVVDSANGEVIAFQIDRPGATHAFALCLYEAIVNRRKPSTLEKSGVQWSMPHLVLSESEPVVENLQSRNEGLPFEVTMRHLNPDKPASRTIAGLRSDWTRDLRSHPVPLRRFERILDNHLWRFHGHGPERSASEIAETHSLLIGYNQDPVDLFPALRRLLPAFSGQIESGRVQHQRLTYEDSLLRLWPGRSVSIVPSQATEAHAWICFGEHVICKASATQLRRGDGTYRPHRERT